MTHTTFYQTSTEWATSSTNIIYTNDYGGYYNYEGNINWWTYKPEHKPKFKAGDVIVYFYYLEWSKKLAIHTIKEIRDGVYIFDNKYYLDEEYTMKPEENDEYFMLLSECKEKYPELLLSATRNGPSEGYVKEKLK